jgi:hypothetical protein
MADKGQQETGWIQNAIKRPGEFTRKAEERGLSPADFQERVLTNPERYDGRTVKQARFRKVLVAIRKKKSS